MRKVYRWAGLISFTLICNISTISSTQQTEHDQQHSLNEHHLQKAHFVKTVMLSSIFRSILASIGGFVISKST